MKFNTSTLELPFSDFLFFFLQTTYKCGLDQTWRGWIPLDFLAGQPESDLDSPALGSQCQQELDWWEIGQTSHLFARVKKKTHTHKKARAASCVGICVTLQ